MAEVWAGTHERTRRPVAVKFVTAAPALRDRFVAAFRHEVRAVAALDHPRVVAVYDHGEVPAGLPFPEGAPWLAMEWCPGGSLGERPPGDWNGTLKLCRDVLGALAHAHAHGVLHRDVKPANVLYTDVGWKLADFGIATTAEGGGASLGTPAYAAPEQIAGRDDDQGPWTDLFAFGCTAWHVICGVPPFGGSLADRRKGRRAPWSPRFDVPVGVLGWLDGLLAALPRDRWKFAADALAALDAIGTPGELRAHPPSGPLAAIAPEATWFDETTEETTVEGVRPADVPAVTASRRPAPEPRGGVSPLADVGLGLIAVRQQPIIGRETERAQLWDALLDTTEVGQSRLIAILGATGTGKTRLARWLCERAHESGAASYVWIAHSVGQDGAIAGVVRSWFGPAHTPGALAARISRRWPAIDPDEATALARLLLGEPLPANSRHALLRRAITRDADRARIIVLDAAPADPDALAFASHLLDAGTANGSGVNGRILIVLTGRPETWSDRPAEAAAVDRLLLRPRAAAVRIGALSSVETAAVVRELLPLDAAFAGQIADHAHGNPGYAIQWVRIQASRGALEPGPSGYQLAAAATDLPDDERAPWRALITRLAEIYPDVRCAEIAAALGDHVDGDEWSRACEAARVPVHLAVLDQLVAWGVCDADRGVTAGIDFTNAFVREALLDHAGANRSLWHAACARVLADAPPDRLGAQLVAAGQRAEGARCLVAGARQRFLDDEDLGALALLSDARAALDGVPGAEAEIERLLADADEVQIQLTLGDARAAERAWRAAERRAANLALPPGARMRLALAKASRAWFAGDNLTALAAYETAWEVSPVVGNGRLTSQALRGMAIVYRRQMRLDEASAWFDLAIEHARTLSDPAPHVFALVGRMELALIMEDLPGARRFASLAEAAAAENTWRTATATVQHMLGDMASAEGRYEDALAHYTIARDWWRTRGGYSQSFAEIHVALMHVRLGHYAVAREGLELRVDRGWLDQVATMRIAVRLALAAVSAGERDFDAMRRDLDIAEAEATALGELDDEYVEWALLAAELAGDHPEAEHARAFAAHQRDRLNARANAGG